MGTALYHLAMSFCLGFTIIFCRSVLSRSRLPGGVGFPIWLRKDNITYGPLLVFWFSINVERYLVYRRCFSYFVSNCQEVVVVAVVKVNFPLVLTQLHLTHPAPVFL